MLSFVLDLLFPSLCQKCGQEGTYLCTPCQQKIEIPPGQCPVCTKPSLIGKVHKECDRRDLALSGLLVAADYKDEAIRNLIWNLKYNSVKEIGNSLATLVADFFISQDLQEYFASCAVIPVPLHKRRLRARGLNQAATIAKQLANKLGWEYMPILRKERQTRSQVELAKAERIENLKGAFASEIRPSLGGKKILLVDDVASTGTTLNECARVLKKQETGEIWGLVVARN